MRVLRRIRCMILGHDWDGYQFTPLTTIRCRKCGLIP